MLRINFFKKYYYVVVTGNLMDNRFHFFNDSNFTDMNYLLLLNLSVLIMILKLRLLKEPENGEVQDF